MKFIDSTQIGVRSGDGGDGMVSFRAARNLPKLGADGGDGGHGGHVYLRGHKGLNTLSHLYFKKKYAAGDGERGGSNGCTGASGEDMVIDVPLGTVARNMVTGEILAEVMVHEKSYRICEGGHRGLGNIRYLSSIHQAPEEFKAGSKGESLEVALELKLIADVGLAGFPNAGKSTLLSVLSAARPKVAGYPFTTLTPQLGVVPMGDLSSTFGASFVMADIPGLIEGASEGRGLGHDFLRHLERTKVVAYVVDEYSLEHEPLEALKTLEKELSRYSETMAQRPSLVVLTKQDACLEGEQEEGELDVASAIEDMGYQVVRVSSVTGMGIESLKLRLYDLISTQKAPEAPQEKAPPAPVTFLQPRLSRSAASRPKLEGYRMVVTSKLNRELGLR